MYEMRKSVLLPERHPTQDFFIADIFDALPVKNDRHTMEHPFFTLSTQKDIRPIEYNRDGVSICLSPSAKYGLPTMMDKDILLYCGSLVVAELNKGNIPPRTIRFSAHDLMVTTNRETNGKGYKLIKNAFERLAGCLITTNIETNDIKQTRGFHLLESFEILERSNDKSRMVKVEVTLSEWFYNSLVAREVLTINRDYFRLRKTLERRLYELARKHCGKQESWCISLENLKNKAGSQSELYKFRFQLRHIIEADKGAGHFPDYRMSLADNDLVTFTQKRSKKDNPPCLALMDIPRISEATLEKGRDITHKAGTGWDFYTLQEQFSLSIHEGFRPDNINGAFLNFIKKKVKTSCSGGA